MNNINTKETIIDLLSKVNRDGMEELISFLEKSDYFTAPASTVHHASYKGGLADHSLHVYRVLNMKSKAYKRNLPEETIILTGLLHDICKVDIYKNVKKWRKNDNGKWEEYEVYAAEDNFPAGHGEKSVIILQKFIKLSDLEIMMIRYHMGPFISKDEYPSFHRAIDLYPDIVLLFTSDFESSAIYEKSK